MLVMLGLCLLGAFDEYSEEVRLSTIAGNPRLPEGAKLDLGFS